MRRWHLTATLLSLAAAAVLTAPSPSEAPIPTATPVVSRPTSGDHASVRLSAELTRPMMQRGVRQARDIVVSIDTSRTTQPFRAPHDISMVIDTSGSMETDRKLSQALTAAYELSERLQEGDTLSLIAFSTRARVVLSQGPPPPAARWTTLLSDLEASGGTNIQDALRAGLAELSTQPDGRSRHLILVSDGQPTIGVTDTGALLKTAALATTDHINITTVGVGVDFDEDLLAGLSDHSGGSYHFAESADQIASAVRSTFTESTSVVGQHGVLDLKLESGVMLERVYGYSTSPHHQGHRVHLGDLKSDTTQHVVVRVSSAATETARHPLLRATLTFFDRNNGAHEELSTRVDAHVVATKDEADASLAPEPHAIAAAARAADLLGRGTVAIERGRPDESQALIREAEDILRAAAITSDVPELQLRAERYAQQRAALSTLDGTAPTARREIIRAKEASREHARF